MYVDEFIKQGGKLTENTKQQLEAEGVPSHLVELALQGQKAQAENYINTLSTVVGGKEQLQELISWGAKNLPEAELQTLDRVYNSLDVNLASTYLLGLKQKYTRDTGYLQGGGIAGNNTVGFKSDYEVREAMKDPRYGRDMNYTNEVDRKLQNSHSLWHNQGGNI